MEDEILKRPSRVLDDNNLFPPGVENESSFELEEKWKRSSSPKRKSKSKSRSRERKTRSRSRERRRSRSNDRRSRRPNFRFSGGGSGGTRDFKDKRRSRERRDMRDIRDRDRSRDRSRDRRDNSRDRGRFRRGNAGRRSPTPPRQRRDWSPKKISQSPHNQMVNQPIVPPPPVVSQPPVYVPPHMFNDGYNNYSGAVQYQNQQPTYNTYDYTTAPPPPSFGPNYPPPPPVLSQPIPPGDEFPAAPNWSIPPPQMLNTQPILSVPVQQQQLLVQSEEDKIKREAAVAQEMQNQRATLRKQREDYRRRAAALKRELKTLKEQRSDLSAGNEPASPTTKGFIKENDRLQSQIQNKLNTIENVIDMLSGIIGKDTMDERQSPNKKNKKNKTSDSNDSSPEVLKSKLIESMHKSKRISESSNSRTTTNEKENRNFKDVKLNVETRNEEKILKKEEEIKIEAPPAPVVQQKKINYIHYDPEMHWCKECDVFPKTAKDYLNHLHSKEHLEKQKLIESPWHSNGNTDEMPTYLNAPTKRTPIRGLQFFIPSNAWYCKLCSIWMGDLHCASSHLKSQIHAEKSNEYLEQNPHFEIDWMAERQKAYENYRDNIPPAPLPPSLLPTPVPPPQLELIVQKSNIFEGIPLQINNQTTVSKSSDVETTKEDKKSKKKKNKKHDDRRDKKKKKKSKKRRRATSSSSSSSDDSTDSDSDKESFKLDDKSNDKSNSIRVAMRNLLKTQQKQEQEKQDEIGRWTIVQTPQGGGNQPISVSLPQNHLDSSENKKKDELIMSQWATPEPIISESEKKLLEDLKGRLKQRSSISDRDDIGGDEKDVRMGRQKIKDREREKERDHFKEKDNNRGYDDGRGDRNRDKDRQKSRERETFDRRGAERRRRSRSRNRRNSPIRRTYRGRRSFSRSRSRTRVIEKAVINYPPEPKPRPPEKKLRPLRGNDPDDPDRKRSPMLKKPVAIPGGKKLPFIGRMPVFKKQSISEDGDKKDELSSEETTDGVEPPPPPPYMMDRHEMRSVMMEDDDDLMPDPAQLMAIMASAPPPPPRMPMPQEEVLPPGIDEADADLVPKPISDAPIIRKGPLPKDFQDALNIIFPGERKPEMELPANKPDDSKNVKASEIMTEIPMEMVMSEELSQQSIDLMYGYGAHNTVAYTNPIQMYGYDQSIPTEIPEIVPPPPVYQDSNGNQLSDIHIINDLVIPPVVNEETKKEIREELDDLALLGIDADDLAAQCI